MSDDPVSQTTEMGLLVGEGTQDKKTCIILPNNRRKLVWDVWMSVLILLTSVYTPFRVAFIDTVDVRMTVVELIVDLFFGIDLVLSFFSAYYNAQEELVENKRTIACRYLRFWFWVDLMSVLPISAIVDSSSAIEVKSLVRVLRLTRLQKMLKMAKLVRMMRLLKQRTKIREQLHRITKGASSPSLERLFLFFVMFFILSHIAACLWYLIARLDDLDENTWVMRYEYQDQTTVPELYVICFYFTVTTITTVGYGDVSAGTTYERLFCMGLMIVGAMSYSFAISSFTNFLSSLDSNEAKLKEKLDTLNAIRSHYDLDFQLYWKLRQSLHYNHHTDMTHQLRFVNELPPQLKVSLSHVLYRKHLDSVPYFANKSPHYIAAVGPLLRPVIVPKGEFVFLEGDPPDALYFLKKGEVGYVTRRRVGPDLIYASLNQGSVFGETDLIPFRGDEPERRSFSVKALTDVELLLLQKTDLYSLGSEFKKEITELFQDSALKL